MFMVEILCGILSGSRFGPNIRTWQTSSGEADLVFIVYFKLFFIRYNITILRANALLQ